MSINPNPDRIPIAHSVVYAARGLPEVPNQYGRGTLAPSEITLTYRAAPDSQLGRVHAYVAGRLRVDGVDLPMPNGLYGQHYFDGLTDWPEWLAEEARLHDPDAVSSAVSVVPPATNQTALRDRIASAIFGAFSDVDVWDCTDARTKAVCRAEADAVLAVLPAPVDQAAVLNRAADFFHGLSLTGTAVTAREVEAELRRLAAEAPHTETPDAGCGCPHPADEHSVYGCAEGCGCEWMPKRSTAVSSRPGTEQEA
ncbi:hypothetical protein QBA79_36420 [Streptomyces scabiei]|uniref:hypothetical protein n=1 Tax=Streptomyces scabiei TaxID=1930 RepID=UPI0029A1B7A5|nr:hypothetical protein [Streptomyces scabiei]MDX2532321.1 hypothetical protein [Streptomyces scabiei]